MIEIVLLVIVGLLLRSLIGERKHRYWSHGRYHEARSHDIRGAVVGAVVLLAILPALLEVVRQILLVMLLGAVTLLLILLVSLTLRSAPARHRKRRV